MIVTALQQHVLWDVMLYLAFFGGQCLTILRRAGIAMRSKHQVYTRRRDFVYANWDVLLIRTIIEVPFYYVWRHNDLGQIAALFGKTIPFKIPDGAIAGFSWGFFVDATLDWLGTLQKLGPWTIPSWIKENIPQLPPAAVGGP